MLLLLTVDACSATRGSYANCICSLTDTVLALSAEWTVLPLIMVRDDLLMTGDTSFAAKHFDQLVSNALGAVGTPWPVDPDNGRECNNAVARM